MFAFGNKTSEDFGIHCTQYTLQKMAGRPYTSYNVLGKSEPEIEVQVHFQPVVIDVECDVIAKDVFEKLEEIKGWLFNSAQGVFIDERQPNRYRTAVVADEITVKMECDTYASLNIRFLCSALLYDIENDPVVIEESETSITNGGTIYSEPVYKLQLLPYDEAAAGIVNFFVGSNYIQLDLTDPEHYKHDIVLDAVRQIVYYADTKQEIMSSTFGLVPMLLIGSNFIYWDNPLISRIEITKNERYV